MKTKVEVDIVIPVREGVDYLKGCLEALKGSTAVPYKLIIVDDGSKSIEMWRALEEAKESGASVLRNDKSFGFAYTCNRGAKVGTSSLLCFLNSDTKVTSGWLEPLVEDFKDPRVAIVGPLLLFTEQENRKIVTGPAGTVQSCGFAFNVRGFPYHRLLGWSKENPKVQQRREDLQAITGACLVTNRRFWDVVRGFNSDYPNTFEDVELGIQAKRLGYKVVYNPKSLVYHAVGGSAEEVGGFRLTESAALFMSRCGAMVKYDEWYLL